MVPINLLFSSLKAFSMVCINIFNYMIILDPKMDFSIYVVFINFPLAFLFSHKSFLTSFDLSVSCFCYCLVIMFPSLSGDISNSKLIPDNAPFCYLEHWDRDFLCNMQSSSYTMSHGHISHGFDFCTLLLVFNSKVYNIFALSN